MASYDEQEASRLLQQFARDAKRGEPSEQILYEASHALLREFSDLARKFGLTVETLNDKEGEGIEISSGPGRQAAMVRIHQGLLEVLTAWGQDKEPLPIAWNPIAQRYEGLEDDPASVAIGYLRPRRSALAVLTEAVVKRLK